MYDYVLHNHIIVLHVYVYIYQIKYIIVFSARESRARDDDALTRPCEWIFFFAHTPP